MEKLRVVGLMTLLTVILVGLGGYIGGNGGAMMFFIIALVGGAFGGYLFGKWLIEFAYEYHMPITFAGTAIGLGIIVAILLLQNIWFRYNKWR